MCEGKFCGHRVGRGAAVGFAEALGTGVTHCEEGK